MPRPRKYASKKTQDAGPRHLSCEACRKRKSKCTRTFPCAGCTERNQECVWTSRPLDGISSRAAPEVVYENKLEIARLQKAVHQLESMIAEREVERKMYLPPTPPEDPVQYYDTRNPAEWDEFDAFFDRTDARDEASNQLPPLASDYRNDPYALPVPPQSSYDALATSVPHRSRTSTWPQRAVPFQTEYNAHQRAPPHTAPLPPYHLESHSGTLHPPHAFDHFSHTFAQVADELPDPPELPHPSFPSLPFEGISYFAPTQSMSSSSYVINHGERPQSVQYAHAQFF